MIRKLASCVGGYKKYAILAPLFVLGSVIMEIVIPFVMAKLIDEGVTPGDMDAILRYGAVLFACTVCTMVFGILGGRSAAAASAGFARNLRRRMYYKVQEFSFTNIDRFSTASLVTRLTTDVSNIQQAFMTVIMVAVRSPFTLVFAFVMAMGVNRSLAMVFLGALPVLALGLFVIMRFAHPLFRRVFRSYDKLNAVVRENVRGVRVVKAFVREEHEKEKFRGISGVIFRDFTKVEKIMAFLNPVMTMTVYVCTLLVSWLGAQLIVVGDMSTGDLMSLMTYTMQILMSLMMLGMVIVMITMSRASAERICAVLDETPDIADGNDPLWSVPDGSIEFRGVSFGYGGRDALCLKDVSLRIESGDTVGIIGGTGSGKSTLVSLIPRLYDADEGAVLVGGADVREYDVKSLRDAVSMVLQKNELFSGTVSDNLRWGDPDAADEELIRACTLAQADGFIRSFPDGYDTVIEQGGANVSGGQKQRLCIARALLKKPRILILDDSTSAVDTATDAAIRQGFREYLPGVTKLIIAQRIASVEDADKVIVMDGGRVADFGTPAELLERCPIYREVYYSQSKGGEDHGAA